MDRALDITNLEPNNNRIYKLKQHSNNDQSEPFKQLESATTAAHSAANSAYSDWKGQDLSNNRVT